MNNERSVSIVRCMAEAKDDEVMQAVTSAVDLIGGCDNIFKGKQKILVKPNVGVDHVRLHKGRQIDLTEPIIVESVIRMIRGCSDSEILIGDGESLELYRKLGYDQIVKKYPNVRLVDFGVEPYEPVVVPNPVMFKHYMLSKELTDIDATVSISKMKAHHAQGATLCLKNLFGLAPKSVYGGIRIYLHDGLVRLPRVLVDLGLIFKPDLCLIDGLVAADNFEWDGPPMEMNVILASYDVVAIDTVGMQVMGLDPKADYPDYPFFYHNNSLNIAREYGLGDNNPENIKVLGYPISDVKKQFEVKLFESVAAVDREFKQKGKSQVRLYRDMRSKFVKEYNGKYLAMGDGKPLWVVDSMDEAVKRFFSSMEQGETLYFLIKVVPEEEETELLDVYEKCL